MAGDGTRTFTWDANDQLLSVTTGTHASEFTYDGAGRRVRIVEKDNGSTTSDKRFLWCGLSICEERDSTGATVTKRFFAQGVRETAGGGASFFYARDHLDSIRELLDSSNTLRARYDYDPWGRRTKLAGDKDADFGYTGHYEHASSGLTLTQYRAYDSTLGRWLSEDPLGSEGGDNLYAYVGGNPLNRLDPDGRAAIVVNYSGYPVNVGNGITLPLGHAAVIAVDEKTGMTQYYEYGRYDSDFGQVKGPADRPVPNLVMDKNGKPTADSLQRLYDFISKHYGKNSPVDPTYDPDADYQQVINFAKQRMNDPKRDPYSWNPLHPNHCKTFAKQAAQSGRKKP